MSSDPRVRIDKHRIGNGVYAAPKGESRKRDIIWSRYEPIVLGNEIDFRAFAGATTDERQAVLWSISPRVDEFEEQALQALVALALRDPDPRIQAEACYLIGAWSEVNKQKAAQFEPQVRRMARYDGNAWVREQAAEAARKLAIVGYDNEIDLELFAVADAYRKIRVLQAVSQHLDDFDDETIQGLADQALRDPNPLIRRIALQRLKERVSEPNLFRATAEFGVKAVYWLKTIGNDLALALKKPRAIPAEGQRARQMSEALADVPTTKDLLDFKRLAVPIARLITAADDRSTPMVIGVYGEWGSGKTSLLKMVTEALHGQDIYPIWFNAWKYEKEENVWSALLQTVLSHAKISGRWYRRIWVRMGILWGTIDLRAGLWEVVTKLQMVIRKITPVLIRLVLVVLSLGIISGWQQQEVEAFLNRLASRLFQSNPAILGIFQARIVTVVVALAVFLAAKPDELLKLFNAKLEMDSTSIDFSKLKRKQTYREHIALLDEFNKDFERIVRLIGRGKPIVIIIDDLDRCLPEKAVQILESVKLFLDVKGCVFLLAADREVVERTVSTRYKDLLAMAREGRDDFPGLTTFLGRNYFEKIVQLPLSIPPLSEGSVRNLIQNLCKDEEVAELCYPIFVRCLPRNPRKIKRNLQLFLFLLDLARFHVEDGTIKPLLLAKLVVIQDQFPTLYRKIADSSWLLWTLEACYDNRDEFDAGVVKSIIDTQQDAYAELAELVPKMVEQTREYATRYPQASLVFSIESVEGTKFADNPIDPYVFFIQAMAEVESVTDIESPVGGRAKTSSYLRRRRFRIPAKRLPEGLEDTASMLEELGRLHGRLTLARRELDLLEANTAQHISQGISSALVHGLDNKRALVAELEEQISIIEQLLEGD